MTVTMDFGDGRISRKSQRSGDNGGQCVFVAVDAAHVGVRDSKQGAAGPALWIRRDEWALVTRLLNG